MNQKSPYFCGGGEGKPKSNQKDGGDGGFGLFCKQKVTSFMDTLLSFAKKEFASK